MLWRKLPLILSIVLCLSCSDVPCTTAGKVGKGVISVPVSIIDEIDAIEADGEAMCEVTIPSSDCEADACFTDSEGVARKRVEVRATARGKCVVSFTFKNGCRTQSATLTFTGPWDNCCADVCLRPGPDDRITESCD